MPFLANHTLTAVADCGGITVTDTSNYDSASESGHELVNFNKYFIIRVTRPLDGNIYEFYTDWASTAAADLNIDPPSDGETVYTVPSSWMTVNGTYTSRLISIPSWGSSYNYEAGDVTYRPTAEGVLFKSLTTNSNSDPQTNPDDWELILLDDILADETTFAKYMSIKTIAISCITGPTETFEASLVDTGVIDVEIDADCDKVTITDNSNFEGNDENGHAESNFTQYRKITFSFPSTGDFVMSSITDDEDADMVITAPSTGNMSFVWDMADSNSDGLYTAKIVNVPSWSSLVYYNSMTASNPVIVFHGDKLWKATEESLGQEPGDDAESWEEYTGIIEDTRYCFEGKFVITCRVIDRCYKNAVVAANCSTTSCCSDNLCTNPNLLKATKLNLIKAEIPWALSNKDWSRIDTLINGALNICDC